jgi:preprotein translocase subunit SecD
MYRIAWACLFVILCAGISLQAQSPRLSIRAAATESVDGWQTMRVEHCQGERCTVWISPILALIESDIEDARPEVRANDGYRRVRVVFTDAGVNKMHDLTMAQLKKHIVLVVDGKVLWAPIVQSIYERSTPKDTLLAGATATGLTLEGLPIVPVSL